TSSRSSSTTSISTGTSGSRSSAALRDRERPAHDALDRERVHLPTKIGIVAGRRDAGLALEQVIELGHELRRASFGAALFDVRLDRRKVALWADLKVFAALQREDRRADLGEPRERILREGLDHPAARTLAAGRQLLVGERGIVDPLCSIDGRT